MGRGGPLSRSISDSVETSVIPGGSGSVPESEAHNREGMELVDEGLDGIE